MMDVATAAIPDIHQHDLVSFGPGLCDGGVVEAEGAAVDDVRSFGVLRFDNSLVTKKASDLTVIDRSYLNIGHVVASASQAGGQIGVITGATTVVDLVRLDERGQVVDVVTGLSPSRLRRARALGLGDLVVSGPWLGQVSDVRVDVDMSFDDGAVCRVADAESIKMLELLTTHGSYLPQKNSPFHPGQRFRSHSTPSVFKDARWLRGEWNADRDEAIGTVVKVEMSGVLIHWIASKHFGTDPLLIEASAPPAYQNPDDLTFFSVAYNHMGWGPADHCFFTELRSTQGFAHDHQLAEEQHHDACLDKVEFPMTVAKTQTYVDVLWQDGTRQRGIPSDSMVPFNIRNEQEFLPGHHVVDNAASLDHSATATNDDTIASDGMKPARRAGVVRTVCCKDQTVNVSWFKAGACPNKAREVECDDTVSAYNLERDPGETPDLGYAVVRLLPPTTSDGEECSPADLSWVGHVIDLPHGHVQVKWGDGIISMVFPHEIVIVCQEDYVVGNHESDEDSRANDEETDEESGSDDEETDEDNDTDEETYEDSGTDDVEEPTVANTGNDPVRPAEDGDAGSDMGEANNFRLSTITGRLTSFIRFLLRFAGEVLCLVKIWPLSWFPRLELTTATDENVGESTDTSEKEKNATYANSDGQSFCFSRFDVLEIPPDHHYLDTPDEGGSGGNSWVKIVQKEWKTLENHLPETIYVRAFEDRMDLLRAVMVGANGTPYQNGLFFFDLQLPQSYPAMPPQVYYHSFGLRLNPNLYESGTVCLSLLNTFDGEGTEVWLPGTSSLLQVLVSIQGLVLNDQPYFNEAGYERQVGTPAGRRNALPYCENAYLLTLQTMLYLLRRPPKGFEGFVKDHFRRRGMFVLRTCEAYLGGCVDDMLMGDANATEAGRVQPCSAGLKLALANVIPSLVAAFKEIGANGCEVFQKL